MRYRPIPARDKNALIGPVTGFRGEHPPDAPSRVGDVAAIARNQMDVHVSDGLAGGRSIVDADVEGVRGEFPVEKSLLFPDDLEQRVMLLGRQVEKRSHVSMRDRERVARRD